MDKTMTFRVGELTRAAKPVSVRAPDASTPCAIGAAQLTHTPSGAPMNMPARLLAKRFLSRSPPSKGNRLSTRAPNRMPKVIPRQLVYIQFRALKPISDRVEASEGTSTITSKPIAASWVSPPTRALSLRAG